MIEIDRSRVPNPFDEDPVLGAMAQKEAEAAVAFFSSDTRHLSERFPFRAYRHPTVLTALQQLFNDKCAYCETPIPGPQDGGVEPFRPLHSVIEAPEHPGYWWLASDWSNLMLACTGCSQNSRAGQGHIGKGGRFPLEDETTRAYEPSLESAERPLLIDPTRDDPSAHLSSFSSWGIIDPITAMGEHTISVFGLNRNQLLSARTQFISDLDVIFDAYYAATVNEDADGIQRWLSRLHQLQDGKQAYTLIARQLLLKMQEHVSLAVTVNAENGETFVDSFLNRRLDETPVGDVESASYDEGKEAEIDAARYDLAKAQDNDFTLYRSKPHPIQSIHLRNFKSHADLELTLGTKKPSRTPWMFLLGENGDGKTSILEAVALTLGGPRVMLDLIENDAISESSLLRQGTEDGEIMVHVQGMRVPHRVVLDTKGMTFHHPIGAAPIRLDFDAHPDANQQAASAEWPISVMLLGFGATRLSETQTHPADEDSDIYRIRNLFDPFSPIRDAQSWMLSPDVDDQLKLDAKEILRDLLELDNTARFGSENGNLTLTEHGATTPFRQWSSGYQTVFTMTVEIIRTLSVIWPRLRTAECIVLIDELDAHLHPRWQMKVVDSLRHALPGVQFISSTHQPLCLNGLARNEVCVIYRDTETGQTKLLDDVPNFNGMRAEQILRSEIFGLYSTNPALDAKIIRYQNLMMAKTGSVAETDEMEQLRDDLDDLAVLGDAPHEQVLFDVLRDFDIDVANSGRSLREKVSREILRTNLLDKLKTDQAGFARPSNTDDQGNSA